MTKLPVPFDLSGECEVGLSEIQFPISWYNVNENETKFMLHQLDEDYVDIPSPVGHYESPIKLVEQINANKIKHRRKSDSVRFYYNQISKKISVKFVLDERCASSLKMTKEKGKLLGFVRKRILKQCRAFF